MVIIPAAGCFCSVHWLRLIRLRLHLACRFDAAAIFMRISADTAADPPQIYAAPLIPSPLYCIPPFEFSGNFCAIASRFRALGSVGICPAPAPAGAAGCSPSLMCACACVWSHFCHISAIFLPLLIAAAPLCRLVLRHHAPPQEKRAFSFALCKRLSVLFRLLLLRLSMVSARLPLTLAAGVRGFR